MEDDLDLAAIIASFCVEADVASIKAYGSGHINDTYLIKNRQGKTPDYLLQRVNHLVFKDVPSLINNIRLVSDHLRKKFDKIPDQHARQDVLTLITTRNGLYYHQDKSGNYWRMYEYIDHAKSSDQIENEKQAFQGGMGFGIFQRSLFDLNASLLTETIPDFHNIAFRLAQLNDAIAADPLSRKQEVFAEIEFILKRTSSMSAILELAENGDLPLRITHNDTKFNNILFDSEDNVKCIIDLDTVMPGYLAYDFGDAIRTIINTAAEDEPDLENIKLNMSLFKAYTNGYLKATASFLTELEIKSLSYGVLLFPYMQAVRFLTDYLNGDTYYKIQFPKHNLQRARAQIQLLKKVEEQYQEIAHFITSLCEVNHI